MIFCIDSSTKHSEAAPRVCSKLPHPRDKRGFFEFGVPPDVLALDEPAPLEDMVRGSGCEEGDEKAKWATTNKLVRASKAVYHHTHTAHSPFPLQSLPHRPLVALISHATYHHFPIPPHIISSAALHLTLSPATNQATMSKYAN